MRLVSWNAQHGVPDPVGRPDLRRAIAPLESLGADVYAFQELDRGRLRTGFAHQGAVLADALGGELVWARAKHWGWAAQGNALVVRGEVVSRQVLDLPGAGERRVAALAQVMTAGRHWSVATTHLSLDPAVAQRQLAVVLAVLRAWPPPHVLAGDLNLVPAVVRPLAEEHGFVAVEGPPTVNARVTPDRRLDHVLVHAAAVTASGVVKLPLSDHLGAWAEVVSTMGPT